MPFGMSFEYISGTWWNSQFKVDDPEHGEVQFVHIYSGSSPKHVILSKTKEFGISYTFRLLDF